MVSGVGVVGLLGSPTVVELGFVSVLVVAFGVLAGIFGYLALRIGKRTHD